jgi:uracil-DNA glycosylase
LFNLNSIHSSWLPYIEKGLGKMDEFYLRNLVNTNDWLPGADKIFRAFSLPLDQINYVLLGESPYPRSQSANGYAFWDQAVTQLWSETGLSKEVNRATSLRNIIKMLLIANGYLKKNQTSQNDIADINKHSLVKTNQEFFTNFLDHGFLLLNACPVLPSDSLHKHARAWQVFIKEIIIGLTHYNQNVEFIMLGNIAKQMNPLLQGIDCKKFYAEHPYNISFITNDQVLRFFAPFNLLKI